MSEIPNSPKVSKIKYADFFRCRVVEKGSEKSCIYGHLPVELTNLPDSQRFKNSNMQIFFRCRVVELAREKSYQYGHSPVEL